MLSRIRTFFARARAGRKISPSGYEYMLVNRAVGGYMAFFWAILCLGGAGLPLGFRIWCGIAALVTFAIHLISAAEAAKWAEIDAKFAASVRRREVRLDSEAFARVEALLDELAADLDEVDAEKET